MNIELTEQQEREFRACADAAGISIEKWIIECAAVKAAAMIDAIQAPMRKASNASKLSNYTINARTAAARRVKSPSVLEAARAYNAKFRRGP